MEEHICHYALLRFLPYREAGEFVNIGVVLTCPALGFLDFALEGRKFKRITDFFPELKSNVAIYRDGLRVMEREFARLRLQNRQDEDAVRAFAALLRPSEALFHFSPPRTLLTTDPQAQLNQLFDTYIERQIKAANSGPEEHLRRRMQSCLQNFGLGRHYKEEDLGDANYAVKFPFVASYKSQNQSIIKAIKPINLAQGKSGEIYQHGDDWLARIQRLSRRGTLPQEILFAVKQPPRGTPQQRAAAEICQELIRFRGVATFDFEEIPQIIQWARIPAFEALIP